jgi:hypothetical protein
MLCLFLPIQPEPWACLGKPAPARTRSTRLPSSPTSRAPTRVCAHGKGGHASVDPSERLELIHPVPAPLRVRECAGEKACMLRSTPSASHFQGEGPPPRRKSPVSAKSSSCPD